MKKYQILLFFLFIFSTNTLAKEPKDETTNLQDIIVTESKAQKKYFADQPYSGNVFVLNDLEEHGINAVQDVTTEIPNFNFLDLGMRSFHSILTVRGVTNTPFFSEPSVVFYIDDIPYGSTSSYANRLYSVEKMEVYRGSQGTIFGKNSYGGVFNVTSQKPSNEIITHVSASYASFNTWTTDAYIDGALIPDKVFFSIGGSYASSDGYIRNNFLQNTPDNEEHVSGHATLFWKPTSGWEVSLIVNGDDFKDDNPHITSLNSRSHLSLQADQIGKLEQNANTTAFKIDYKKNDFRFLSVTSRRDWQLNPFFLDIDLSSTPFLSLQIDQRQIQWNQEFRISSIQKDISWSLGTFTSIGESDIGRIFNVFNTPVILHNGKLKDENYAAFANISYNITNYFRLHAGLRLDYIEKKLNRYINTTVRLKRDRNFFHISPKISIDYALFDDLLLYASTGMTFKPGGFSMSTENPKMSEYDSETMWASEFGLKSQWLENRVKTNAAFFYYQINDYQTEKFTTPVDYTIINASKTISYGVELEAGIELTPGLQLETSFGYTRIRFEKFRDPVTRVNLQGNRPPYVPEKTLMIAGQYKHPSGFFLRSEWVWNDKIYYDTENSAAYTEDDYSVVNTRLGYQSKSFNFYLYGENLNNSNHYSFILPAINAGAPVKPRSFGLEGSLIF